MVKQKVVEPYTCLACGEEDCDFVVIDFPEVMGDECYANAHYQCDKCGNEWDTTMCFVLKWEKRA